MPTRRKTAEIIAADQPPESPPGEPGDVRMEKGTTRVAYKTSLGPGRQWFVMTEDGGGHYTDGIREDVGSWRKAR